MLFGTPPPAAQAAAAGGRRGGNPARAQAAGDAVTEGMVKLALLLLMFWLLRLLSNDEAETRENAENPISSSSRSSSLSKGCVRVCAPPRRPPGCVIIIGCCGCCGSNAIFWNPEGRGTGTRRGMQEEEALAVDTTEAAGQSGRVVIHSAEAAAGGSGGGKEKSELLLLLHVMRSLSVLLARNEEEGAPLVVVLVEGARAAAGGGRDKEGKTGAIEEERDGKADEVHVERLERTSQPTAGPLLSCAASPSPSAALELIKVGQAKTEEEAVEREEEGSDEDKEHAEAELMGDKEGIVDSKAGLVEQASEGGAAEGEEGECVH